MKKTIFTVILVSMLFLIGCAKPNTFLPEQCVIVEGLTCAEWEADEESITLTLMNGLGDLTEFKLRLDECGEQGAISEILVPSGDMFQVTIPCEGLVPGERFQSEITFSSEQEDGTGKITVEVK